MAARIVAMWNSTLKKKRRVRENGVLREISPAHCGFKSHPGTSMLKMRAP